MATRTPTHYPVNRNFFPSYIDLLVNKNVLGLTDLEIVNELSSDHVPLVCKLSAGKVERGDGVEQKSFKNANWRLFRQIMSTKTIINYNIESIEQLEREVELLTENLQFATKKISKTIIKRTTPEDKLPDEIVRLIAFQNKIRKRWQKRRNPLDWRRIGDLQNTIRKKIFDYKNKIWSDVLNDLSVKDGSLWRLINRIKDKNKSEKIPSLNNNVQTKDEIAETIAQHLEKIHMGSPNSSPEQDRITEIVGKFAHQKFPIPPTQWAKIITTPKDIDDILKGLANNKAPGIDGIPNIVLKNLTRKTKIQLMYITNAIVSLQHFPKSWKEAIIVPVLKPGKDRNKVESYRPISLLNCISKVVERAIYNKINNLYDIEGKFPKEQYGFKTGHNTTALLAKVLSSVVEKFNENQSTVLLSLDVKSAFDSVWHNGLAYKNLKIHNFPPYVVSLLHSFLLLRKFKVRVEDGFSSTKNIRAGVPQGAILSPKLYNLYTADFPKFPNSNLALYADDALLYAHSFSANVACKKIKNSHNFATQYLLALR